MKTRVGKLQNVRNRISLCTDWYKLVFPFNRLCARGATLHLRNGAVMRVRSVFSQDVPVLQELFQHDPYEVARMDLPDRPVVIDIGANIGAFCILVRLHRPHVTLVAYEPHPVNYSLLKENAPFAELHQEAVAGSRGTSHITAEGSEVAFRLSQEGIPVSAVTLGDVLASRPRADLLKVDIEGAEYEVFSAAPVGILNSVQRVVMEIHDATRFEWFAERLRREGLTVSRNEAGNLYARRSP